MGAQDWLAILVGLGLGLTSMSSSASPEDGRCCRIAATAWPAATGVEWDWVSRCWRSAEDTSHWLPWLSSDATSRPHHVLLHVEPLLAGWLALHAASCRGAYPCAAQAPAPLPRRQLVTALLGLGCAVSALPCLALSFMYVPAATAPACRGLANCCAGLFPKASAAVTHDPSA